ncbi:hypothetical protein [Amycolatopsis sp. EV170708-02-1]|uniref:hypothetical protein n=1 Tax=Amycolatopsis sp. EV170708-02-1 TaxID=2919322 RepID=UPI001F0B9F21|nr:hypothetical protein [Amycolatopsis sp. EV170708-02-1]UMP01942.1 hypothetical protein MJQ72_36930 [Amycolatopsis sp. EV170708-02-1]
MIRPALVLACGVALVAPAVAYAQDAPPTSPKADPYPFLGLSPRQSEAGEEILVSVGCPVGELGEVKSKVLDRIGEFTVTNEVPVIQGAVAHIDAAARPAFYTITAICKTTTITANLQVVPGKTPTSSSKPPAPKPTVLPKPSSPGKPASGRQVSKIPVGAPQTGGGGTAR